MQPMPSAESLRAFGQIRFPPVARWLSEPHHRRHPTRGRIRWGPAGQRGL